jgi:hypothetical protein
VIFGCGLIADGLVVFALGAARTAPEPVGEAA